MSFSLYDATVPPYLQQLRALAGLIDKAEAYCKEKGLPPEELLNARLAPDMYPFAMQINVAVAHSAHAVAAVQKGVFAPDRSPPENSFAALRKLVDDGIKLIEQVQPETINSLMGRDMAFVVPDVRLEFTVEDYLMSFARPNFYFHTVAAYSILRMKGVPIGKKDYMGAMRMKV